MRPAPRSPRCWSAGPPARRPTRTCARPSGARARRRAAGRPAGPGRPAGRAAGRLSSDPYVYPGTTVLCNARGIRDADELRRVEGCLTSLRAARLATERLPGRYDLAHLQAFHHALFEGLYEWAGELRTVAIAKPSALFSLPEHLESYGADVFGRPRLVGGLTTGEIARGR